MALIGGNLAVLAMLALVTTLSLQASREGLTLRARQAAENLAATLSVNVASEIKQVDNALLSTNQQLNRLQAFGKLDTALATVVANEQKAQVPQVGTVRVTDASGLVLNSGQPTPVSVGDRDYFAQARAQPDKLIISEPLQGRIIKGWGIILARARLGADGSFQGVAYANLSTQHFVDLFNHFNLGPQGAVSLRSPTLKLVARYAVGDKTPDAGIGKVSLSAESLTVMQGNPEQGFMLNRTSIDGVERVGAYRRVPIYGLTVLAGLGTDDYFSLWRREAEQQTGLTLLLAALVVGGSLLFYIRQKRQWRAQQEIAELAAERGAMLDNSLVGSVRLKGRVAQWHNQALADLFGYPPNGLLGQNSRVLYPDDASYELVGQGYSHFSGGGQFRTQIQMRHKDGHLMWMDVSGAPLPDGESLWMMVDITAVKDSEMQAKHQALHDNLTGLANRLQLTDALAYVLRNSERHSHKVAVCYIDLDGFKAVNDTQGHDAGDAVLREAARRMNASVRGSDLVARLGGDEFVIILGELHNRDELRVALNRLLATLQQPMQLVTGQQATVSASIGVALYPEHGLQQETLMTRADEALYLAKRTGKNRFAIYGHVTGDAVEAGGTTLAE